jgi:hypothetical protein
MEVKITQSLLNRAQQHAVSDEDLVSFLKRSGLSKSLSVIAFAHVREVPVPVAKFAVHASRAWSGQRATDEALQSAIFKVLRSEGA